MTIALFLCSFGSVLAKSLIATPSESLAPYLARLQPGDTLLLRGGVYRESVSLPHDGTTGAPIVITNYAGEQPVIKSNKTVLSLSHDHWVVKGLVIDQEGAAADAIKISGRFITITDCQIRNGQKDGIDGSGSSQNVTISHCVIHDFLNPSGADAHGIVVSPGARDWQILDNEIYDCGGDCVQLYAKDETPVAEYSKAFIIARNKMYTTLGANSENALDFKGIDSCLVDGNEMYGFENKAWVVQKGCRNITGSNNVIHDSQRGIEFRSEGGKLQENVRLHRNLLYNIRDYYAIKFDGVANVEATHNTLANVNANSFRVEGGGVRGGFFRNNLIYNSESPAIKATFDCASDHNGWFQAPAGELAGTGDLNAADPRFENAGANSYRLRANSPAIDAGVDVGQPYTGTRPDLGAYEFDDRGTGVDEFPDGTREHNTAPQQFQLNEAFPNPFRAKQNISTQVVIAVQQPIIANVAIFDLAGRKLRTLYDSRLPVGQHSLRWDGCTEHGHLAATGIYFLIVVSHAAGIARQRESRKIILLQD